MGICQIYGPIAQLAEHRADNAGVSGSIPLGPTKKLSVNSFKNCFFVFEDCFGPVAQLGEHLLCKQGVRSSNLLRSRRVEYSVFRKKYEKHKSAH